MYSRSISSIDSPKTGSTELVRLPIFRESQALVEAKPSYFNHLAIPVTGSVRAFQFRNRGCGALKLPSLKDTACPLGKGLAKTGHPA